MTLCHLESAIFINPCGTAYVFTVRAEGRFGHTMFFLQTQTAHDERAGESAFAAWAAYADKFCIAALAVVFFVFRCVDESPYLPGNLIGAHIPCDLPELRVKDGFVVKPGL